MLAWDCHLPRCTMMATICSFRAVQQLGLGARAPSAPASASACAVLQAATHRGALTGTPQALSNSGLATARHLAPPASCSITRESGPPLRHQRHSCCALAASASAFGFQERARGRQSQHSTARGSSPPPPTSVAPGGGPQAQPERGASTVQPRQGGRMERCSTHMHASSLSSSTRAWPRLPCASKVWWWAGQLHAARTGRVLPPRPTASVNVVRMPPHRPLHSLWGCSYSRRFRCW